MLTLWEKVAQNCQFIHYSPPSSLDRDSNLDLPVPGSLAQHETSVLANYGTKAGHCARPGFEAQSPLQLQRDQCEETNALDNSAIDWKRDAHSPNRPKASDFLVNFTEGGDTCLADASVSMRE
uniref:(California timema) hypothetical protein n=1 Tax=Timema californicum TaxID=61474 RepID=A0A7R9J8U1_TIMCA|nr:unnamed protein product [Timema californicum]